VRDTHGDGIPMDDDQPLYLPEEFEREHLDEARRVVAASRGGRAIARRVTATLPGRDGRGRSPLAIAASIHAVAALFVITITVATGTWAIGLVMLGLTAVSFAVVARVLHVLAAGHVRQPAAPDAPRPRPRGPR
jgi:hypothetical protein